MPGRGVTWSRSLLAQSGGSGGGGGGGGGGTDPSGVDMPTTAPTGWVPYWRQNFNTDVARGNFLGTYGSNGASFNSTEALTFGRVNSAGYVDTRQGRSPADGHFGRYDPNGLSCVDGKMQMHIWWDPTLDVTGNMRVACPIAKLSNVGTWGDHGSRRTSVRARYVGTNRATTKIAWLSWPTINHSTTSATAGIPDATGTYGFRGGDGEIDFPEQDNYSTVKFFMHKQNAKSTDTPSTPIYGDKQTSGTSPIDFYDGNWHTWTKEIITGSYNTGTATWVGQSAKFFADGAQVGTTQTKAVPMTTMRENLQTETTLSAGTPLDQTIDYLIEVDWWTVDVPG